MLSFVSSLPDRGDTSAVQAAGPEYSQSVSQSVLTLCLLQTEMAGEEELGLLLSNISGSTENIELSLEEIHQILSLPPEVRPRTTSLSVSSPESGISSSGDFPEDLSPWPSNTVTLHAYQEE